MSNETGKPQGYSVARVGRQSLIYGGGIMLAKLAGLAMMPVYFGVLTAAEYGIIALVEVAFDMLTIIAGSRLATGVFRFYHKAQTEREKAEVVTSALILIASLYAMVGTAAFLGAEELALLVFGDAADYTGIMRLASISFILQGVMFAPMAYFRLRDEARLYVTADVIKLLLQLSLNIYFLVYLRRGVEGVFMANVLATALIAVPITVYLLRHTGLRFSRTAAGNLVRFGAPMIINQIATFFVTFGDRIVLQRVATESEVGVYAVAFSFGIMTVSIGYTPYQMIWDPVRYEVVNHPDKDLYLGRGFRHLNVLLLSVAVALALFTGDVIAVMGGETKFSEAGMLVPFIIVAHVFLTWAAVQDIGILVTEKTKYVALANWIAAGVALAGFAVLIPAFWALGAALTCLFSFFTRWLMIYTFSQRLWPVRYHWPPILRVFGAAVATAVVSALLPSMWLVQSIAIHGVLGLMFLGVLWRSGIVISEEKAELGKALRNPMQALQRLRVG